jgi:Holliday junction resolvase RusA-like endonuclease
MLAFHLPCHPPETTAQMKRIRVMPTVGRNGVRKMRPTFYKTAAAKKELADWAMLCRRYRPAAPLDGALSLHIVFVYPHLSDTPKRDLPRWLPKTTMPDVSNAVKAFEDVLVQEGFMVDDSRVADLRVSKYRAPDAAVGIYVELDTFKEVASWTPPVAVQRATGY